MEIVLFYPKKEGHCVSIFRSFEPLVRKLRESNDVKEYFVPCEGGNPFNMLRNILYVRKHSTKNGVNHITGDIHYCILGLLNLPSVLTIHDDFALRMHKKGVLDKLRKYLLWYYFPIKCAKSVICISPQTKKNIYSHLKSDKYVVLAHHCMSEDFTYSPKRFNVECPVIFQVGTTPHKNLETTILAITGLNCKLLVLKKMSSDQMELAKKNNIVFRNIYNVSNDKVIEAYQESDIVIFPSLCEGFGMPIVEAQSTGRPVITSNMAPMNWVAGSDSALLLNNPKDYNELRLKIKKIINDATLRDSLISKGLENVKRFSINQIYENYMLIYQSVLKNGCSR